MSVTFDPAPAHSAPLSVSFRPALDPAEFLPAGIPADRYRALALRAEDLRKLTVDFDERYQLSLDRVAAEQRLQRMVGHRSTGSSELPDSDARVVAVRQELAKRTSEQARLAERDATRSAEWRSCATLLSSVSAWIRDGRPGNTVMQAIEVPSPRLLKSETAVAAIDRLRQQARALRAKLKQLENAPVPIALARARLREQLGAIARRGEINIDKLLTQAGGEIGFPSLQHITRVFNTAEPTAAAIGALPDVVGMLVAANLEAMTALLDKKIAAAADDARAMTPAEKDKQTAQIMAELFALEVDEGTLTVAAWRDGLPVGANEAINPAAFFALENIVAPPFNPSPGSSREHAWDVAGPRR